MIALLWGVLAGCYNGVLGWAVNTTSAAPRDVRNARMHAITCIMHMTKYDELCRDSIRCVGGWRVVALRLVALR